MRPVKAQYRDAVVLCNFKVRTRDAIFHVTSQTLEILVRRYSRRRNEFYFYDVARDESHRLNTHASNAARVVSRCNLLVATSHEKLYRVSAPLSKATTHRSHNSGQRCTEKLLCIGSLLGTF